VQWVPYLRRFTGFQIVQFGSYIFVEMNTKLYNSKEEEILERASGFPFNKIVTSELYNPESFWINISLPDCIVHKPLFFPKMLMDCTIRKIALRYFLKLELVKFVNLNNM